MKSRFIPALALCAASLAAQADVTLASASATYSQNFNGLTALTTTQTFSNDGTLAGWSLFNGGGAAIGSYIGGNGNSNAGTFYSFGTDAADRAFGGVTSGGAYFGSAATGSVAGYIALSLSNQSGGTLDSLSLSYTGEQWRNGGNASAQSIVLQYGFGSSYGTVGAWSDAGSAFNFVSPITGASIAVLDGNAAANRVTGLGGTLGSLAWANGDTLWLRWQYTNNQGNDHGLAIDDLSLSVAAAVPEPAPAALLAAGLGAIGLLARRRSTRG